MTAEEILDSHYEPKMHWKSVNRKRVLLAMKEYARQERSKGFPSTEEVCEAIKETTKKACKSKETAIKFLEEAGII